MPWKLSDLIDIPNLQILMNRFHAATAIPVGIIASDGEVVVATGWQEICTHFHRIHPVTAERCRQSDDYIKTLLTTDNCVQYKCRNGLWDMAVPIIIAREHVATLFLGQFFYDDEKIDEEFFLRQAREMGFETAPYMEALRRIPVFTRERVRQIIDFYITFVNFLVSMGLANCQRAEAENALRESEEKFSMTFHAAPISMAISTIDEGRLLEVNKSFERMYGYSRDEVIGKTSAELNIWDDLLERQEVVSRLKMGEEIHDWEITQRDKDGRPHSTLCSAVIIDLDGEKRLLSLRNDITARKMAEEALREAHDQMELRVRERTAELEEVNKALEAEIAEREAAEKEVLRLNRLYAVLGMTNHTIVRAKERERLFSDICRGVVEQGGFRMAWVGLINDESGMVEPVAWHGANDGYLDGIRVSVREEPAGLGPVGSAIRDGRYYICNDFLNDPRTLIWQEAGRERGFHSAAAITLTLNGKVIGALAIYSGEAHFFGIQMIELLEQMAMDISFALDNLDHEERHRKAERALHEEAMERLKTLENLREKERMLIQQSRQAAMGEMIENIAHQWRQPLNNLGLIMQLLPYSYEQGEFSKDYLTTVVANSMSIIGHMSQTIDDFRNFFKPDKEKVEFKVLDEITKTLSLVEGGLKSQWIKVEVDATDHPTIHGFPNEYSQVLLTILNNARDAFSIRKIEEPKVRINLFSNNDKAVVTIADNAGGIPDDILHKIFDPYFTTKGPDKGTGVGLFMSKTIIEKYMNGSLTVRNTGDGAEFRIAL